MGKLDIKIENVKGKLLVSSRVIAEQLEKQHKHVLDSIKEVSRNLGSPQDYFIKSEYVNKQNKKQPEYLITKDGFTMLVMNYQGYYEFKETYIKQFNQMEQTLAKWNITRERGIEARRGMTDAIKDSGENERMKGHAYSTYTKLIYKLLGVNGVKRDKMQQEQLEKIKKLEGIVKSLLDFDMEYSEVKAELERLTQYYTQGKLK